MEFLACFSTLAGMASLTVALTETMIKAWNVSKKWVKQLISWLTPMVLSCVGFALQLGLFANYGMITDWKGWVITLVTGFGIGLISNGIFEMGWVQTLINVVEQWIKNLKVKKNDVEEITQQPSEE